MSKFGGGDSKNTLYCSFCDKSQNEVRKLIAGPTVFICAECVELCADIISEENKSSLAKSRDGIPTPKEIRKVLDDYYTKPAAFESIIKSQTLWCSHYRTMLDQDEVRSMRDLLPPAVAPRMDAIVEQLNRHTRRLWDTSGRGAQTASDLVNSLYGATIDGRAEYSALDPYLFSFSTHSEDTAFDREHGIKSQWEYYAGPQGYCSVFDICQLAELLKLEGAMRYWAWLMLQPVRYNDRRIEEIFPELVEGLADILQQFLNGNRTPEVTAKEFLIGATLLKGINYKPEREVRIVAIPGTAQAAKYAAKEFPAEFDTSAPLPEIKTRPDTDKRYIVLFDGLGGRLPIKRIIVGPGENQQERAERARVLLGGIPVSLSLSH
jgi:hypothetical protein